MSYPSTNRELELMKGKIIFVFLPYFEKKLGKTKFLKPLKIAVSERLSEICQKNKEIQSHFSLIANLKIKPYEFNQKPE